MIWGKSFGQCSRRLNDVRRLRSFLSLHDLELDGIAFLKAFIAFGRNCTVVNKYIGPIITPDKSVTLRVIEPLDGSFQSFHVRPPSTFSFSYRVALRPCQSFSAILLLGFGAVKNIGGCKALLARLPPMIEPQYRRDRFRVANSACGCHAHSF